MAKFHCIHCGNVFKKSYFKWLFTTVFHTFTKRLTKCPKCGKKSWMKPLK